PRRLNFLRYLDGLAAVENVEAGAMGDNDPVFADADAADRRRAQTARDLGDRPKGRLVGAVVLRDVQRMLFHKIEALAEFECGTDRLAVVFGDGEQAVDAVVAFRILDAAGANGGGIRRLCSGRDFDAVDVELAVERGRAVGVDTENKIAGDR